MESELPLKLSVGSAHEYEELIAEIFFPGKFGLIISQEKSEGSFEISVHSFSESSANDFDHCKNVDSEKISLEILNEAIQKATSELKRLARKD